MLSREKIRMGLEKSILQDQPVIGVAVGSGLSAKQAIEGGADLLLVLNAGRFRTIGVSSLGCMMPFANSNEMVMNFGTQEIIPRIKDKPIIFGVCATDPTINQDQLLDRIIFNGFHGLNNFPSVGLIDGIFRNVLEENNLGFAKEVELMTKAVARGLFTIAFVFNEAQAEEMAKINVDVICAHLGWTTGGETGVKQGISLQKGIELANRIFEVSNRINPDAFNMFYGGPIKDPEQAKDFYNHTPAVGYIGGSSFERIPTEVSIKETTDRFKNFAKLKKENENLKKELIKKKGFDEIAGQSRVMQEIYDIVSKVADKNINVLIYGESGTGKELIVRAIHYNSSRFNSPFVKVNCAALPENLLESELFGHEKGSFTGATQQRLGRFELAHKGTLFLDEIGEMSLKTQAKLLRAIQQQEFERVGGNKTIKVDVRILCATNIDLSKAVARGKFREDLYYRLNVISIHTPPLRNHKEDIPLLVNHFLKKVNEKFQRNIRKLTTAALEAFMQYDWPGNVRELEHTLERSVILCDEDVIGLKDLPAHFQSITSFIETPLETDRFSSLANKTTAALEKQLIIEALERFSWNRTKTSEFLGITRRTLFNKINKYRIKK
ncbi:MAG: phosphoenolpyruvate hydrolase family protein [Peptococcaceae bacterium]